MLITFSTFHKLCIWSLVLNTLLIEIQCDQCTKDQPAAHILSCSDMTADAKVSMTRNCVCKTNCLSIKLKCLSGGNWSQNFQDCDVRQYSHQHHNLNLNVNFNNSVFEFTCEPGYVLQQSNVTVYCVAGAIQGKRPTCIRANVPAMTNTSAPSTMIKLSKKPSTEAEITEQPFSLEIIMVIVVLSIMVVILVIIFGLLVRSIYFKQSQDKQVNLEMKVISPEENPPRERKTSRSQSDPLPPIPNSSTHQDVMETVSLTTADHSEEEEI